MKDFLSQAAKLLKKQKQYRYRAVAFLCLAVLVGYGTVMALKLYGQAMTHKMEVLDCQYEVHEHTDECYGLDGEGNRLSEEPVCGYADYAIHVHNDVCYGKDGELVCILEEHEAHGHTEECYVTEMVLVCGEEAEGGTDGQDGEAQAPEGETPDGTVPGNPEDAGSAAGAEEGAEPQQEEIACGKEEHQHDESCYENVPGCSYAEEHTHTTDCISHGLECEAAEHTHAEGCYDAEGNMICGMEEHIHEIGCYDEEGNTLCNTENHIHDDSCLDAEGKIACGPEGHVHIVGCYRNSYSCGKEAHVHSESCDTQNLICGLEEHVHEDICYAPETEPTGAEATTAPAENGTDTAEGSTAPGEGATEGHVHTDACYEEAVRLACGELELHTHDDSCYTEDCFDEEGNLVEGSVSSCGLPQLEEHTHSEACIKTVELTPEEVEALNQGAKLHIHTDECYDEEGSLVCGHDATHIHVPECYDDAGTVICGYGTAVHVHEDKCYDGEGSLTCGYETAKHPHNGNCYDGEGNLQCGYETDTHVHGDSCYDEEGNVACGYAAAAHIHGKECYDGEGNLLCGYETAKHVHEEGCYGEEGKLICGYNEDGYAVAALYCDEGIHTHAENCYDENQVLVCGKADFAAHTHTEDCYNVDGLPICPLPEAEAHTHSEACYGQDGEDLAEGGTEEGAEDEAGLTCGKEELQLHTHTEVCYDGNGALTCGQMEIMEHVHSEACLVSKEPVTKTFQGESFIVTATYKPDANIPEEAELVAEQITEESNGEHYAKRQAEYQEALGDDKATMRALLKIGFYVNGEEVEPESPVTVTIQFLNEDGLAEGKAITVLHFAEEGTELLEGSEVENGSTTFEMESFSEIAVGYGVENVKVPVNEELKYDTDELEVTFRIEGEVTVPIGDTKAGEAGTEGENAVPGEPAGGEMEEGGTEDGSVADEAEADSMVSEDGVSVIIENSALDKKLEFRVDPLGEEAEEYAKAMAAVYGEGAEALENQLFLQVLSYKVMYDGKKLDLSNCTVTAEIKPSAALVEYAETAVDPMTLDLDSEEQIAEGLDVKPEVVITAVEESEIADAVVVNPEAVEDPMHVTLGNGTVAIAGTSQADRIFTVQYYANLDMLKMDADTSKVETLKVIDTSGGILPQNGRKESTPVLGIQANEEPQNVSSSFGNAVTVATENKLTEVYSEKEYHYITHPSLTYFNILAENGNYELDEIWVLKEGGDKASTERDNWDIYDCEERDWHFTNRIETSLKEPDFIYIRENAVIRLVCNVTTDKPVNNTMFYDYDISNGNIYSSGAADKTIDRGNSTTYNDKNGATWYLYTNKQGINNNSNNHSGGTGGQVFGFGNGPGVNKTGMGLLTWNGYTLNMANDKSYSDCTFGLVQNLKPDGTIQYSGGVNAPNMFNDGAANGKTEHNGHLTFERKGDTYTLIAAEAGGTTIENLDKFYGRKNWNGSRYIWSNLFYPLDGVSSAGTKKHDIMFGDTTSFNGSKLMATTKSEQMKLPQSDDGKAHNHYFGMYYTVDFDLTEEYVGPLEYIFYGDDDMWVFLNGEGKKIERTKDAEGNEVVTETPESINGKLVCDIGGVHSSVGEYVNLWDYIDKGTEGHFTLSFFYTERGASGSTCWMQFTLPSVSFKTPNQTTGQMQIKKLVTGKDTNEEFGFEIKFYNAEGERLRDSYAYTKSSENGDVIDNDLLIWNNAKFFMKANEIIEISYLPVGTIFEITEIGPVTVERDDEGNVVRDEDGNPVWAVKDRNPYTPSIDGGDVAADNPAKVTGIISQGKVIEIQYNNAYQYELPETGGTGTILYTMAGGMVVLAGAGFLYKKKFRERRARKSL